MQKKDISFRQRLTRDGFITTEPLPNIEELRDLYADFYYQQQKSKTYQKKYSQLELKHKRLKAEVLLHALKSSNLSLINGGKFVDIGTGEGFLLRAAQKSGFEVTGNDFSEYGLAQFHPGLIPFLIKGDVYN